MASALGTDEKRAWLGKFYRGTSNSTLLGRLEAENDKQVAAMQSGGAMTGTSANGHSVQFASPSSGGTSFGMMAALCAEMIRRYTEASDYLISTGIVAPTDAQIYVEMLAQLIACDSFSSDYSLLRSGVGVQIA